MERSERYEPLFNFNLGVVRTKEEEEGAYVNVAFN